MSVAACFETETDTADACIVGVTLVSSRVLAEAKTRARACVCMHVRVGGCPMPVHSHCCGSSHMKVRLEVEHARSGA